MNRRNFLGSILATPAVVALPAIAAPAAVIGVDLAGPEGDATVVMRGDYTCDVRGSPLMVVQEIYPADGDWTLRPRKVWYVRP